MASRVVGGGGDEDSVLVAAALPLFPDSAAALPWLVRTPVRCASSNRGAPLRAVRYGISRVALGNVETIPRAELCREYSEGEEGRREVD